MQLLSDAFDDREVQFSSLFVQFSFCYSSRFVVCYVLVQCPIYGRLLVLYVRVECQGVSEASSCLVLYSVDIILYRLLYCIQYSMIRDT